MSPLAEYSVRLVQKHDSGHHWLHCRAATPRAAADMAQNDAEEHGLHRDDLLVTVFAGRVHNSIGSEPVLEVGAT